VSANDQLLRMLLWKLKTKKLGIA